MPPEPLDPRTPPLHTPRRIDLHVHTLASSVSGEAALEAIACPECYSSPADVYAQAKRGGMDFVAITDHDTLDGALSLAGRDDLLVGEELTCWFPEDHCKIHLLLYGIDPGTHERVQALADDLYRVAEFVERERIAHAVAHPLYRQNDRLERWHLDRLILLFKGFECLNGAHSSLHRESLEAVLDRLTPAEIARLGDQHHLLPRWDRPWEKSRTGGSDDHGLVNVGRTWTEFPGQTGTIAEVLACLREGRCRPGGEAGSSLKLAHAFYAVGARYATGARSPTSAARRSRRSPTVSILHSLIGETAPTPQRGRRVRDAFLGAARHAARALARPLRRRRPRELGGTALLAELFSRSVATRIGQHPPLLEALRAGLPPLGEHREVFTLLESLNADVADGIADAAERHLGRGEGMKLFDLLSTVAAQQFVLAPYYFALFHQNKERRHLPSLTNLPSRKDPRDLRIGLFTDTFDEINGVARFIRDMGEQATRAGRAFHVATSTEQTRFTLPNRENFRPTLSRAMPYYPELKLSLPPVLHMLEWADRQQFDVIHVSTPGPVGLVGWLAAKMLRVPVLMTYHTDFPAYVENLTGDHRLTSGMSWYMSWFYRNAASVFSRSQSYQQNLRSLGVPERRLLTIVPGINTAKFNPTRRDPRLLASLGVTRRHTLLYAGRVSLEKNLPLLLEAFRLLCARRDDVTLVVAGDGPYLDTLRRELANLPARCLGFQSDEQLGGLYASCDLFVFPSRTDTLGQVVMEAQASGLPAIVSDEGGPKETVADQISGLVLPATDPSAWCDAIDRLLDDPATRQRFSRSAVTRSSRYSLAATFEHFWHEHARVLEPPDASLPAPRLAPSPTEHPHAVGT
jgi:glycosyltransferase involved in cell wall biosynthesis